MADTGLMAAPAAAATARHGKPQTPPLGVYSSAEDTDSEAEADRAREDEEDEDRRRRQERHRRQHQQRQQHRHQQHHQQEPVCLTARSNAISNNNNDNNIVNNCINNNNNNSTRNKRKNFQPRNISYTQETAEDGSADNGNGGASDGGDQPAAGGHSTGAAAAAVLDLSACTGSTVAKRPRVDDGSAPMDLTCAVQSPAAAADNKRSSSATITAAAQAAATHGVQHLLAAAINAGHHHPHLPPHLHHQPHEATDLKEYAQNTVRELLEIYGLNTDVADAITATVPMVNFSTGRILESLAARGVGLYPALNLPLQLAAQQQKPASVSSPSPRSSPANSAPSSPTQKHATPSVIVPLPSAHRETSGTTVAMTSLGIQTLSPHSAVTAPLTVPTPTYTNAQDNGISVRSLSPLALTTVRSSEPHTTPSSSIATAPVTMGLQVTTPGGGGGNGCPTPTSGDYSRYVRRFSSCQECGSARCRDLNYREHFHCLDCNSRVFVKKEEMIRHFKWHKKRDESLQHGFMRYSPSDDCSDRYQGCSHNRKQTHYHCIQGTCDKVYISTSDVQMHANYHRKDSAIIQEGFQRLRATEECRTPYCAFYGQRTTHFHCRRDHCQFTFKNKADMEKHKTYHIKDEQLARDGFKKFMKPDPCGFSNCRFSQVCNHIHCVRDGCNYVLHSSGQLLSHKRKHERKDSEIAYRKFKLAQQAVLNMSSSCVSTGSGSGVGPATGVGQDQVSDDEWGLPWDARRRGVHGATDSQMNELSISSNSPLQFLHQQANSLASLSALANQVGDAASYSNSSSDGGGGPMSPLSTTPRGPSKMGGGGGHGFFTDNSCTAVDGGVGSPEDVEMWPRYLTRFKPNTCTGGPDCALYDTDHFHCKEPNCDAPVKSQEAAETHARNHDNQERINESFYPGGPAYCQDTCTKEQHFHCVLEGCYEAVLPSERGEHIKSHHDTPYGQYNSLDALFRRKRGRPPKNRVIEVWNDCAGVSTGDSPQAIFTSFKLPKPSLTGQQSEEAEIPTQTTLEQHCFEQYRYGCPDNLCKYTSEGVALHYHCRRPRCFFATDNDEQLQAHSTHFHDNVTIMEGFLFFDSSVDCRLETCANNTINKHFHCVRAGCGFSFTRYSQMAQHLLQHQATVGMHISDKLAETQIKEEVLSPARPQATPSPSDSATSQRSTTVVKASGTFYPMSGLSNAKSSSPNFSDTATLTEKSKTDGNSLSIEPVVTIQVLPEWMSLERHEKYGPEQPCSRAFCKLKRKEHYHCNACNQAFSEVDKLKPHIIKHTPGAIPTFMQKTENVNNNNNDDTEEIAQHPPVLTMMPIAGDNNSAGMPHSPYPPGFGAAMAAAMANHQQFASLMTSQALPFMPHAIQAMYSSPTGLMFAPPGFNHHQTMLTNGLLKRASEAAVVGNDPTAAAAPPHHNGPVSPSQDMSPEMRKARVQNSMRILKDEPVPEGYLRFRFNEDCHYTHCGYREHQTHFHCMRQDCGYSFCDKTRFVQHTARHERLDTLMGGDFQQYRANVSCGRADCAYTSAISTGQNKASHFHCLKCEFVCTDTNKVVAHRRQHQKLDSIMAAGFEKFTPAQACGQPGGCVHSGKQTHYHCLSCQYAVLGLSQMTAHKYRHME
ncbi:Hypothetical protein CINCED_3A025642 [Cinara cedri]|nr:Hypothetical protein CINCED_3A025642 [Cinara cedri]